MTLRSGFALGAWTVYPLEARLANDDSETQIQPKSMDVLLCLAESAGAVVERERLLHATLYRRPVVRATICIICMQAALMMRSPHFKLR